VALAGKVASSTQIVLQRAIAEKALVFFGFIRGYASVLQNPFLAATQTMMRPLKLCIKE
jgi:hypothetical protein